MILKCDLIFSTIIINVNYINEEYVNINADYIVFKMSFKYLNYMSSCLHYIFALYNSFQR